MRAIPLTNRGFTLVELLIAMTILIMLIGSATWAHRFFTEQWERLSRRDDSIAKELITLQQLTYPLASTASYTQFLNKTKLGYVWRGSSNQFAGVTNFSLFYPQQASAYRMSFSNTDSGCVLLYQEASLVAASVEINTILSMNMDKQIAVPFNYSCRGFTYLGWAPVDVTQEEESQMLFDVKQTQWLSRYDGVDNESIPLGVKLQFESVDNRYHTFSLSNTLIENVTFSEVSIE